MQQPKRFTDSRANTSKIYLDERYDTIGETPAAFRGIELKPHQMTSIAALRNIEETGQITITNITTITSYNKYMGTGSAIITTNAAVLSDCLGSGKTFIALGFVMSPKPRPRVELCNELIPSTYVYKAEIRRKFTKRGALIDAALIIVGGSVLKQWLESITSYTTLNVFPVGDLNGLRRFIQALESGEIIKYDIVLVKNGRAQDPDDSRVITSLVKLMSRACTGRVWRRAIYDDFDTINIPTEAGGINALFHLYISATRKIGSAPTRARCEFIERLENRYAYLVDAGSDQALFDVFNVCNSKRYLEKSLSVMIPEMYKYVYNNPKDTLINILGRLGDADNVVEALNGDAVMTAAKELGIVTNSVADIVKKAMGDKYDSYISAHRTIETIQKLAPRIKTLPLFDGPEYAFPAAFIDDCIAKLKAGETPELEYVTSVLKARIIELLKENQAIWKRDGAAIERVRENIRTGSCQVCRASLSDSHVLIVRCCGLVMCQPCVIHGNRMTKDKDDIRGTCANCRATIYGKRDLIFISGEFDLNNLITARGDEAEPIYSEPKASEISDPKLAALLSILQGKKPDGRRVADVTINGLMTGTIDLPRTNEPIKTIIFAKYDETLINVEKFLTENGISHIRLSGTYHMVKNTINAFRNSVDVLLINSQHNCAGICLEFATDLVFMHKIADHNITAQVCGRIQRFGRSCNAKIHWLLYNNESEI